MLKTYVAFTNQLAKLRQNESGAALVEYALLVGLIAAAAATFVGTLNTNVSGAFGKIGTHLNAIS